MGHANIKFGKKYKKRKNKNNRKIKKIKKKMCSGRGGNLLYFLCLISNKQPQLGTVFLATTIVTCYSHLILRPSSPAKKTTAEKD